MKDERERVKVGGTVTSLGNIPKDQLQSQGRHVTLSQSNVLIFDFDMILRLFQNYIQ